MTKCPACGHDTNQQQGNQIAEATLTIPVEMFVAMQHALSLAVSTAYMEEFNKKDLRSLAFKAMLEELGKQIPSCIEHIEDKLWTKVCLRAKRGNTLKAKVFERRKFGSWGDIEGHYVGIVDDEGKDLIHPSNYDVGRAKVFETAIEASKLEADLQDILDQITQMEPAAAPMV